MTRKGYKHTELGEIPEDWEVKTLGDAFDYIQPTTYLVRSTDYSSYGIPVLTAGKTFILGYTTEREGVFNDLPIVIFDDFTTESKYVTFSFKAKSSAMKMLKAKPNVDEYYAYLALQTVDYTVGSHERHWISKFQYLPIPLPPLPEQRAIASALSDVDALIEALDRLIDKKRKIKQGTMQQLLSGKKRLKGFGKGKGYKHTELGEIPEDWEVKTLGDAFDYIQPTPYLVRSTDYSSYGIPVLTAGKTFILGYTTEREGIFNDLPIIIFDDFTTESKYVTFSFKAKSSAMKMLKAKPNVDIYYAYLALQTVDYTIGGHERHWISKFQYLPVPLPPLPEQRAIASALSDMDAEIESLEAKRNKYTKIKQGMMQDLLTGRVRLPVKEV